MFQIRITVNNCEKLRTKIPEWSNSQWKALSILLPVQVKEKYFQICRRGQETRKKWKPCITSSLDTPVDAISLNRGSLIWWKCSSFWVRVRRGVQTLNTTLFTIIVNSEFSNDPWLTPEFMNGSFHKQFLKQVDRVDPPQYDCISIA